MVWCIFREILEFNEEENRNLNCDTLTVSMQTPGGVLIRLSICSNFLFSSTALLLFLLYPIRNGEQRTHYHISAILIGTSRCTLFKQFNFKSFITSSNKIQFFVNAKTTFLNFHSGRRSELSYDAHSSLFGH